MENVKVTLLAAEELKCNYLYNPLGVDTPDPKLSWELRSHERNQYQKAYRILVSTSEEVLDKDIGDLWDSGKVESDNSIHIHYSGKALKSRQGCYWKVQVWDRDDRICPWSKTAYWEMGLLNKKDWQGRWIGANSIGPADPAPAPLLRRTIHLDKKVVSARAYICGLGYYELYINGNRIGDQVLAPGFTRYDMTALYDTYDVTEAFSEGKNAFGVILGNGWYNCFTNVAWGFENAPWRDFPKLLFQVHIHFDDGEETVVCSDLNWRISTGSIIFDGLRNGEFYDARLEKPGWSEPAYDDSEWNKPVILKGPGGILKSQQLTVIKVTDTITPVNLKEVKPGVWVFDLGQNIAGWARLKVSGPAGTEITLRYAEKVTGDGDIDPSNINTLVKYGEFQTDKYILKGDGIEIWEPRFTYHGFQYVQVTGFPGTPSLESISGRVVHTAFENHGEFSCSNELFNKIQKCTRWSTLGNYHSIPTDCPHREKNGWTGDAQLSAEQTLLNFNPMTAYTKWMADFKDVQRLNGDLPGVVPTGSFGYGLSPAWDSTVVLIPWFMYIYCGDTSILEMMYENMKRYVDFLTATSVDNLVEFDLGDWCPPTGGVKGYKCPTIVTSTSYYYVDAVILSKVAVLLGNAEDAEEYRTLALKIRESFRRNFFNKDTGVVEGNCQTSMACALYQGLIDEEEVPKILSALVKQVEVMDYHIDCGILGTKFVMHTLNDLGRADLAYMMASQTTFPGWGYWIEQGATTLWETWDGTESRNHHMFGDISAWFYKGLAGINPDPDMPGFKHIIIRPNPVGDLRWVNAWHKSMYGQITCNWSIEKDIFKLDVDIPANCTATVYLPSCKPENVMESGNPIQTQPEIAVRGRENGRTFLNIGSGQYRFEMMLDK